MSNLVVQNINSNLVIDSRLIAEELGIQHKSFKESIRTYESDFEQFGEVTLETAQGKPLQQGGFGQGETFYYLNEDQAYLSLTYSKNTTQVRTAKINLVKAFKQARESKTPQSYIQSLELLLASEKEKERLRIEAEMLKETNNNLNEENKELNAFKEEVSEYDKFIELLEISKNEVNDLIYSHGVTINDFLIDWNNSANDEDRLDPEYWATVSKRASAYFRLLEGKHPLKNNKNRTIFVGRKTAYIIATIRLIQSGI